MKTKLKKAEKVKGQMAVHISGYGSEHPDESVKSHVVEAEISKKGNRFIFSFPVDHPWLPIQGKLNCNLHEFSTDRFDFNLYRIEAIQLDPNSFLILLGYVWKNVRKLENFQGVAKFAGKVPAGLSPKFGPEAA